MVRRGRPLMRAAMVGGVAYHAGKNVHQDAAAAPAPAAPQAVSPTRRSLSSRSSAS